jgi:hypothetical protein
VPNRKHPRVLKIANFQNGLWIAGPAVQAELLDQLLDQEHVGQEGLVFTGLIRH